MFTIDKPRQLDSEELGGLGAALRNAMGVYGNMQTLKKQTTENNFLPQEKAEGLKKLIAEAIMKEQEARVAPEMQDAKLAYEKLTAPNLQAQTNQTNQATRRSSALLPYDVESAKTGAAQKREDYSQSLKMNPLDINAKKTSNNSADLALLLKQLTMPDEVRNSHTGADQKSLDYLTSQIKLPYEINKLKLEEKYGEKEKEAGLEEKAASAFWKRHGGAGGSAGGKDFQQLKNIVALKNPDIANDDDKLTEATGHYIEGEDKMNDGTALAPAGGEIGYWTDKLNRQRYGAGAENQKRYADTLEALFKKADLNAPSAFKFAGLVGKTKGGLDAAIGQVGKNDPDYMKYRAFVEEDVPAMASEIIRAGGANSTNSQKAMAYQQAFNDSINTNPKIAENNYKELKMLYREIGKSISKSVTQRDKDLRGAATENTETLKTAVTGNTDNSGGWHYDPKTSSWSEK